MISMKSESFKEGVSVESEVNGVAKDIGIEALHLIAVLMREIKRDSDSVHMAILATLAEYPSILLGDYMADKEIIKGDLN